MVIILSTIIHRFHNQRLNRIDCIIILARIKEEKLQIAEEAERKHIELVARQEEVRLNRRNEKRDLLRKTNIEKRKKERSDRFKEMVNIAMSVLTEAKWQHTTHCRHQRHSRDHVVVGNVVLNTFKAVDFIEINEMNVKT